MQTYIDELAATLGDDENAGTATPKLHISTYHDCIDQARRLRGPLAHILHGLDGAGLSDGISGDADRASFTYCRNGYAYRVVVEAVK